MFEETTRLNGSMYLTHIFKRNVKFDLIKKDYRWNKTKFTPAKWSCVLISKYYLNLVAIVAFTCPKLTLLLLAKKWYNKKLKATFSQGDQCCATRVTKCEVWSEDARFLT